MRRARSVWRWQLILAGTTTTIAIVVAALEPRLFADAEFVSGLILMVLTTLGALLTPWHRLPRTMINALPFVDIVAIGLMAGPSNLRLGFLWVFPIAWIASYQPPIWIAGALALIGASMVHDVVRDGISSAYALRIIIVLLSLAFIGITINMGATRTRATGRLLRRQSEQLARTVRRVESQERRVVQVIDAIETALAAVDAAGKIVAMNSAYRDLYARGSADGIHPSPSVEYDARRGEPLPPEATSLARAASGESIDGDRLWVFDAEGRWRALAMSTRPLDVAPGQPTTTLLVIDDVTADLEAETRRNGVTTVISHELRNPLTAIVGHVDLLLERDDLPTDARDQLAVIENAGQRMQRLVTRTLDDADTTADAAPARFDLRRVVDASVQSFRPTIDAAGVTITVRGPGSVPLDGDAFRLRQVIDNLLGNAVKYTMRGGRIEVELVRADLETTDLTIADTGIGIGADDLPHVFEPRFRAETAVHSGRPGNGLGMGIAREIVQRHQGSIDLTSTLGIGTRVTLRLPSGLAKEDSE